MEQKMSDTLIALSVIAVAISAYVNISQKELLNLAGTQWILIGIALGIYGLYVKNRKT